MKNLIFPILIQYCAFYVCHIALILYICIFVNMYFFLNITTDISISDSLFIIVIITMINIATVNDYKYL